MKTGEINQFLTRGLTRKFYRGAFPADICFNFKAPYCVVMNCDSHNGPGSHWIAWFVTKSTIYFFDSMGRSPRDPSLPKEFGLFIKNKKKTVVYNHKVVEGIFSRTCGEFCIFVLWHLCKGNKWKDILNRFDNNETVESTLANDELVQNFVKKLKK